VSADDPTRLVKRARELVEDLDLSTLGWRIPSQTLIEDFAAHEHRLRAEEHEMTDIGPRATDTRPGAHSASMSSTPIRAPHRW
jgi:hypothetical protein